MSAHENYKITVAVEKTLEPGVAMNTIAHLTLGLAGLLHAKHPALADALQFLTYRSADDAMFPFVSARSLIVLRAKQGELRTLRDNALSLGLPSTYFVDAMTGDTYVEQLERASRTPFAEMKVHGVACFGLRSEIEPLTRRLSLWR